MLELIVQQTNSTVTTTVLQSAGGLSSSDWISLFSGAAMIAVTIALAYYARVAIVEAKNGRRRDSLEKQLENVYSPLYDILRKAKFAEDRQLIRNYPPQREYALTEDEFKRIGEIIERFGHYLGGQERMAISNVLEHNYDMLLDSHIADGKYYRYHLVDIDKHWIFIWKTSEGLRRELEELTERKRKTWRDNFHLVCLIPSSAKTRTFPMCHFEAFKTKEQSEPMH